MRYLFILLCFISFEISAQCKTSITGVNGDKLNCIDINGKKQGRWVVKVESLRGERGYEEEGEYKNGKKEGIWRRYSLEGDIIAMENFRFGEKHGRNVYFNHIGEPLREEAWRAIDPANPYDTVNVYDVNDPTKIIGRQVVKLEGLTVKHGTWKYFDPMTGRIEKSENWVFDKLKMPVSEDDELAPIDISTDTKAEGATAKKEVKKVPSKKPQAILDYEKKNAGKKKIKVRDGNTGG